MTLAEYLKQNRLSMREFGSRFTPPVSTGMVWQWLRWEADPSAQYATAISAKRAAQIERITQGALKRVDIRPDIFADAA